VFEKSFHLQKKKSFSRIEQINDQWVTGNAVNLRVDAGDAEGVQDG
jgi:hypothetical protein